MATPTDIEHLEGIEEYRYGFSDPDTAVYKARKGLDEDVVRKISAMKQEPQWMLDFRLKALEHFMARPMPTWGGDLSRMDLDNIYYYSRPACASRSNCSGNTSGPSSPTPTTNSRP